MVAVWMDVVSVLWRLRVMDKRRSGGLPEIACSLLVARSGVFVRSWEDGRRVSWASVVGMDAVPVTSVRKVGRGCGRV